jgi:Ca2+-transporting ATPase
MTTIEQPPVAEGLSSAEARARLARFGLNSMVPHARFGRLRALLDTLLDPMATMLLVAAAIYLLLGERRDATILGVAALAVFAVDVIMEARSSRALSALAGAVKPRTRVIRDGREVEVMTEALVPGDFIVIGEGDVIHADGVVRWAANLAIDESLLSGEAEPRDKEAYAGPAGEAHDDRHRLLAGSIALSGHGYGEIVATGMRTRYGEIARLVAGAPLEAAPLERKIARAARALLMVAALVAGAIFLLRWLGGGASPAQSFLYAITVAISAVPEEFPLVFTLFLTLGAWRLAGRGVLVRRLAAIETLGSTTVICLDKTGTLTHARGDRARLRVARGRSAGTGDPRPLSGAWRGGRRGTRAVAAHDRLPVRNRRQTHVARLDGEIPERRPRRAGANRRQGGAGGNPRALRARRRRASTD